MAIALGARPDMLPCVWSTAVKLPVDWQQALDQSQADLFECDARGLTGQRRFLQPQDLMYGNWRHKF